MLHDCESPDGEIWIWRGNLEVYDHEYGWMVNRGKINFCPYCGEDLREKKEKE